MRIFLLSALSTILAPALALLPPSAWAEAPLSCWQAEPMADPWGTIDACTPQASDHRLSDAERSQAYASMAEAHAGLGLSDQARDEYLRAAQLETDPRPLTVIAWALNGAGWPAEAETLYDRALKGDDSMTHAWLARCVVRQAQEHWAASLPDCRRAYADWKDSEDVLYFLTKGFIMVDDPVNAQPFARYASQQHPGSARIWVLRVWAEEIAGNRTEARALAERQLQAFPGNTGLENYLRRAAE